MNRSMSTIILILTATTTALIGGLFYSYSCSVNPGLGRLPDASYIAAMQSINKAIINPLFMMSFLGTLILLPLCTYSNYSAPASLRFYLLLAATILYAVGVFGVTMFGNVPLNDALARVDLQTSSALQIKEHRLAFEDPWNSLHRIRSIASVGTLILVILACVLGRQSSEDYIL
ncbi:MAG TPA: anthrone oxygenase family protein [Ohtaekwangia sp.]|uniref:anthrone oxygenase family protein n=1 Tax=Ohtaekwangia sp. TaxID=2066019 RepID=UPI002F94516B